MSCVLASDVLLECAARQACADNGSSIFVLVSSNRNWEKGDRIAFTFTEVLIATGLLLTVFVTIYCCLAMGLRTTQLTRQTLRATQILTDKLEGVRLYNWSQLNDPTFFRNTFTNFFYETNNIGTATASGSGVLYTGQVALASVPFTNSYNTNVLKMTVTVGWVGSGQVHTRMMSTYVGQWGVQNYNYLK